MSEITDEFKAGFRKGYNIAVQNVLKNRDHWRSLLQLPAETHRETIDRIYGQPPRSPETETKITDVIAVVADGVDLYVVLPGEIPEDFELVQTDGSLSIKFTSPDSLSKSTR